MTLRRSMSVACGIGLVLGMVLGVLVGRRDFHEERWDRRGTGRLLDRFSRELVLTPDQRRRVAVILEAKRQKVEELRVQMRPKFDEIRASAHDEIQTILSPSQQVRFERLRAEHEARVKAWRATSAASRS